jgi:hypothetical protein
MYGVPVDLPIERFLGDSLTQIRIGIDGIHFVFNQTGIIGVFGLWQLHDANGEMIDHTQEHRDQFSTGHQITIYDDTSQYESCTINSEDGLMIVI